MSTSYKHQLLLLLLATPLALAGGSDSGSGERDSGRGDGGSGFGGGDGGSALGDGLGGLGDGLGLGGIGEGLEGISGWGSDATFKKDIGWSWSYSDSSAHDALDSCMGGKNSRGCKGAECCAAESTSAMNNEISSTLRAWGGDCQAKGIGAYSSYCGRCMQPTISASQEIPAPTAPSYTQPTPTSVYYPTYTVVQQSSAQVQPTYTVPSCNGTDCGGDPLPTTVAPAPTIVPSTPDNGSGSDSGSGSGSGSGAIGTEGCVCQDLTTMTTATTAPTASMCLCDVTNSSSPIACSCSSSFALPTSSIPPISSDSSDSSFSPVSGVSSISPVSSISAAPAISPISSISAAPAISSISAISPISSISAAPAISSISPIFFSASRICSCPSSASAASSPLQSNVTSPLASSPSPAIVRGGANTLRMAGAGIGSAFAAVLVGLLAVAL